jgi:RNA polymerase sigma-70 factor (ECF subfamily)
VSNILPESNAIAALAATGMNRAALATALEREVVQLFDHLRKPLLRYLFTFSLTVPDSEDILQEAFLALFLHLREGKSRHNLRGWLFRVAHNLALKRRQNQRNFESIPEATGDTEKSLIDAAPNPEDQVATRQTQGRIMAVLQALPEQNRWCLSLRAEGLRYREIAEILNISLGSVSVCLERSLAQIARVAKR